MIDILYYASSAILITAGFYLGVRVGRSHGRSESIEMHKDINKDNKDFDESNIHIGDMFYSAYVDCYAMVTNKGRGDNNRVYIRYKVRDRDKESWSKAELTSFVDDFILCYTTHIDWMLQ